MSKRYTLADVVKLDRIVDSEVVLGRCVYSAPGHPRVWAFPNSNHRGDQWFDCRLETDTRRYEYFELSGRPSDVGRMLAREVRDFANEST
jgi:hypothetical protein